MTDSRVLTNRTVFISGSSILAIQSSNEPLPPGLTLTINGEGKYITPALIEGHTHVFDRADLAAYLVHGVTLVRNMMGFPMHLRWRDQVAGGEFPGSQMITAAPTINGELTDTVPLHLNISSPGEGRDAVARFKAMGYDFIKIYDGLSPEQFEAIISEARLQGMAVAGHPPHHVDPERIITAGLTSLEHVEEIFQGLLAFEFDEERAQQIAREMRDAGLPVTVTLSAYERIYRCVTEGEDYLNRLDDKKINPLIRYLGHQSLDGWTNPHPDGRDWTIRKYKFMERVVQILRRNGVTLLLGTDTGPNLTVPGETLHDEIRLLSALGLTNFEIISSATADPARVFGIKNRGTIEIGAEAELLLVERNPLEDLSSLRAPIGVLTNGRWYNEEELEKIRTLSTMHSNAYVTLGRFLDQALIH